MRCPDELSAERRIRSVDRELYRPQGDVTPEVVCSPVNAIMQMIILSTE
jgi:hypothetical protein